MLNDLADIKPLWNPDELGLSDSPETPDGASPYERFLEKLSQKADRRISRLVSPEVFSAAGEDVKAAEIEFMSVFVLEHLWMMKAAGSEKQIEMPGGFKIYLQEFSSDDYKQLVLAHVYNAERELGL